MAEPTEPRDEIINDLCLRNDTLRRERDEAVAVMERARKALHTAERFAVEFDSPVTMFDPAMPYKSGEVCAEALTAMEKIDAYLDKREEG